MSLQRPSGYRGDAPAKSIAVVSGKGGSGKTMVAVALAQGAAATGQSVILIDADFGTGGLTYYLSFRVFSKLKFGITDLFHNNEMASKMGDWAASPNIDQHDPSLHGIRLVPIGSQTRIRDDIDEKMVSALEAAIKHAKLISNFVIVDCRGGVDYQSLAVCTIVDEVVVVVETDATSIRSSQHLVNELDEGGLKAKIVGFLLNKVIDDPTTLAMTANSLMQVDYLGPIPFDIDATRSYIQGKLPDFSSLFVRHVLHVISRIMPEVGTFYDRVSVLSPSDFSQVTLGRPETRVGGALLAFLFFYASATVMFSLYILKSSEKFVDKWQVAVGIFVANTVILAMLSDELKQRLGRVFRTYNSSFGKIFGFSRRGR